MCEFFLRNQIVENSEQNVVMPWLQLGHSDCIHSKNKPPAMQVCPDHIHMFVRIPPKYSVSEVMGYLKGKSSLMIFERHANLKYKYGNRHFQCRGYYVDTVGKNAKKIEEYIRNQLREDLEYDPMSLKEYVDLFTGETVKQNK